MNLDATQLMRCGDELAKYLYLRGSRRVRISYDFGEERSFCAISAPDYLLDEAERTRILKVFSGPIQPEIASYYGALAGRRRDGAEIELLGTMAELEDLMVTEGGGTQIVLSRREAEYFGKRKKR
ncbi:MAG: hypothetical protein JXA15_12415 [Spirochaetales bacterium]|nr:hypothetical protein [Spirochaetales bacterium]